MTDPEPGWEDALCRLLLVYDARQLAAELGVDVNALRVWLQEEHDPAPKIRVRIVDVYLRCRRELFLAADAITEYRQALDGVLEHDVPPETRSYVHNALERLDEQFTEPFLELKH